jgi:hypothetical protein
MDKEILLTYFRRSTSMLLPPTRRYPCTGSISSPRPSFWWCSEGTPDVHPVAFPPAGEYRVDIGARRSSGLPSVIACANLKLEIS